MKILLDVINYILGMNTIPPPLGGTAILPEYIHYYGYYYQVIVRAVLINIITGVSPPHFDFVVFYVLSMLRNFLTIK
jgi:hypothetical protein